jgi:hypothetical protein
MQSCWQALSIGCCSHFLTSGAADPASTGVLTLFPDISREGTIPSLGNLFQWLKTPDILGTRPLLLHLKLIFFGQ